ncbi:hypothetical protein R69746_08417 [Paraburkholderia aspalathi]|uniref:cyclase family protein n=1 Tax=Paraburkholderia aspalathi TaxID=1324617 RepID=UPI001B2803C2|nr:cyclase family protein [Paraburkholderia aspalathi]CAE6870833.1 hypothetical protein R69746_08417 [Paraburkholderia aspalathi]
MSQNAAKLVRKGKVSLGLNFDRDGTQKGHLGNRFDPLHTMLATVTDAVAGNQDAGGLQYAYDAVSFPLQCGTQWDALRHIFFDDKMWNGYYARLVHSDGAQKNGIEKTKTKMVGGGALLDIARYLDVHSLRDGDAISIEELKAPQRAPGVTVRRGDFLIVRTGHIERCLHEGDWGGYAGGSAPGLAFETANWVHGNQIAAISAYTWGCEVRPNETDDCTQPWQRSDELLP